MTKEQCIKVAGRLRGERDKRGLSQEKLRAAMNDMSGVEISLQSIKNYEAMETNSKNESNKGMKIETLMNYAKFYGVSTDYLLGLTDEPSPDITIQGASKLTGLSGEVLDVLSANYNLAKTDPNRDAIFADVLNVILCGKYKNIGAQMFREIWIYLFEEFFAEEINDGLLVNSGNSNYVRVKHRRGELEGYYLFPVETLLESCLLKIQQSLAQIQKDLRAREKSAESEG
jgi:transcriptional regulator with XRE-family HTH domain